MNYRSKFTFKKLFHLKKTVKPGIITALAIISLMNPYHADAQRTGSSQNAGEQRFAEKGLKDNSYFFYFINTSVSNFGSEEAEEIFEEAIRRDIIARQLYMKFLFHESFQEVKAAQKLLIKLYRKTIINDINIARNLLNEFAAHVIHSDSSRAREYLRLGYRDTENAIIEMQMADNFRETLYSMRLYKYTRAIKNAKHSRRYAFHAMTTVQSDELFFEPGRLSFEKQAELIETISDSPEKQELYRTIHMDNYYLVKDEPSIFDRVWADPRLSEIPEYEDYLKIR